MQRIPYPGGWYCERMPDGKFVQGYPNGTFLLNDIPLIRGINILQLRLAPNGLWFAGPDHGSFDIIEWDGAEFKSRGPNCGQSPAAYWPDSSLQITRTCEYPPQGSQGIRWIDTVIHWGADTRQPQGDGIFEWTELDGIKVGQGDAGGIAIKYQGVKHVLEEGQFTDFVRFNKSGNLLGIACWNHSINAGVHFLLTVQEIASLPLYPVPQPIPPQPMPQPPKVTISSYDPKSGPSPLKVRAVAELSGGPADFLFWRADNVDVVKNPASDLDHTFTFTTAGKHNIGVRVEGPGGSDQTGKLREVEVISPNPIPPDPIPPQPQPPTAKKYWLKTIWGDYVYLDGDNVWKHGLESRTAFTFENFIEGNYVAIKAFKYTAAEPPNGLLISNRDTASDWEKFIQGRNQFGTTFKALSTGKFIRAHDGVVFADASEAHDQEAFTLEEAKTDVSPVHTDRHVFRFADNSRYYWAHVTAFSAFRDWIHGERNKLESFAQWTLSIGANGWRVFGNWSRAEAALDFRTTPDYFQHLSAFCQWMLEHGLRLEFCAITDHIPPSLSEENQFLQDCANVLRNFPNTFLEAANECWQNAATDDGSAFVVPSGVLFCRGTAQTNDGLPIYTAAPNGASYSAYHSPRDAEFHRKGKDLKEIYDTYSTAYPTGTRQATVDNEPTRPDQQGFNVAKFWQAGATRAMFGAGATFHGGANTLQLCNVPPQSESDCAKAFIEGIFAVPPDAPHWEYGRYGEAAPSTPHVVADQLAETGTGHAIRVYEMSSSNHACAIAVDGEHPVAINGWSAVKYDGPNQCFVILER